MGRQNDVGLQYFSVDVDMFQDKRIRRLSRTHGRGVEVYLYILSCVYRDKGYYLEVEDDTYFDIADQIRIDEDEVKAIIDFCVNVGLFDKQLLDECGLLTSHSIQLRYIDTMNRIKRSHINTDYIVLTSEEKALFPRYFGSNTPTPPQSSEETAIVSEEMAVVTEEKGQYSSSNSSSIVGYSIKETKEENNLSVTPASKEERECFYDIFFFKNFLDPAATVEAFCNNYEASGWVRKNGQKVVDRVALAKTWAQDSAITQKPFPPGFLDNWRILVDDARKKKPESVRVLIEQLKGAVMESNKVILLCRSDSLMQEIRKDVDYYTRFYDKFFPGKIIKYRVLSVLNK